MNKLYILIDMNINFLPIFPIGRPRLALLGFGSSFFVRFFVLLGFLIVFNKTGLSQGAGGPYGSVCKNGTDITLIGSPAPVSGISTGTWSSVTASAAIIENASSVDATAIFDVSAAPAGPHTVIYTFDADSDPSTTNEVYMETIEVFEPKELTLSSYGPLCESEASIILTGSPSPLAGETATWTGAGIMESSSNDAIATFSPTGLSGPIQVCYTLRTANTNNNCISTECINITVNDAMITSDLSDYCVSSTTDVPLTGSHSPTSSTWSGSGVTGTSFNPAAAGVGTHTITYSYTAYINHRLIISNRIAVRFSLN